MDYENPNNNGLGTMINLSPQMKAEGGLKMNTENTHGINLSSLYHFECFDNEGNLKWEEYEKNIVVNEGLQYVLDIAFKDGDKSTSWFCGLKVGAATLAIATDTLSNHGGWDEALLNTYTVGGNTTRAPVNWGSINTTHQRLDNSSSKCIFDIVTGDEVHGALLCDNNGVTNLTTGMLYGAVNFANPRTVVTGDQLQVTITVQAADG